MARFDQAMPMLKNEVNHGIVFMDRMRVRGNPRVTSRALSLPTDRRAEFNRRCRWHKSSRTLLRYLDARSLDHFWVLRPRFLAYRRHRYRAYRFEVEEKLGLSTFLIVPPFA